MIKQQAIMEQNRKKILIPIAAAILIVLVATLWLTRSPASVDQDWPMWGHDPGRSFASNTDLPLQPELLWKRSLGDPQRAWPYQQDDYTLRSTHPVYGKLSFDVSYEPVAGGGRIYVPSMVSDHVTAYSADDGEQLWRFYADGPVRFAPVYNQERLFVISDDGYLYALAADSGAELWKYKGSYSDRLVLGNERIISMWPARGGPILDEDVIYFSSGILPFEGVFVHAVCSITGEALWTNSTSGTLWDLHQHSGAYSFGGPAPQGYLALTDDHLIVPGGRTPPAVYDRHTGEFLYFRQATGEVGRGAGGYRVQTMGDWFFNHGLLYALEDGALFGQIPGSVLVKNKFIGLSNNQIVAHSSNLSRTETTVEDRLERQAIRAEYEIHPLWSSEEIEDLRYLHFQSSRHLGISRKGGRVALLPLDRRGQPGSLSWEENLDSEVWTMFPADGKLFVVTENGTLYAYGDSQGLPPRIHTLETRLPRVSQELRSTLRRHLASHEALQGYALVFGGDPEWLPALALESDWHLLGVYPDRNSVQRARQRLEQTGLYGSRVAVRQGYLHEMQLPSFLADAVVWAEQSLDEKHLARAFELLRPYGGRLYLSGSMENPLSLLPESLRNQAAAESHEGIAVLVRKGPLPGAGSWTHQYADASNRVYSPEDHVKAPLGTLWFGGPSNDKLAPYRHANYPIPQVIGGRMIILGQKHISARCVYTGRELWEYELEGFDYLQPPYLYDPGANFIGSPFVSAEESVYIIHGDECLRLDLHTGEKIDRFTLPSREELMRMARRTGDQPPAWSYAMQLMEKGVPSEVHNANIPRAMERYPYQYDLSGPEDLNRIEPGTYYIGVAGRTGHRHRNNAEIRHFEVVIDGEPVALNRRTPERGLFFEYTSAESGHAAGGLEFGTVLTESPHRLSADSRLEISRWSDSQYDRVFLFGSIEEVENIPLHIQEFTNAQPDQYSGSLQAWGNLRISGDYLITAAYPHMFDDRRPGQSLNWNATSSEFLVVLNRHNGQINWVRQASYGFRHNAIAGSADRVFAIDHLSEEIRTQMGRRGIYPQTRPRIYSWNLADGSRLWECDREVFGTWLGYYQDKDILIEGGRSGGLRNLPDEPDRSIVARTGSRGALIWESSEPYSGPLGLHEEMIIPGRPGQLHLDPYTGEILLRDHPLTGQPYPFRYHKYYGCGTMNASRHLLAFRSGAAGYADLVDYGGTANLGGFRSGCTNNLVAADGVLIAPDYTKTCTCSYQLQTSFAFAHMPEVELWTINRIEHHREPVKSLGINFGAPGNRRAGEVLWLEYPQVYNAGLQAPVSVRFDDNFEKEKSWFRHHASWIRNPDQDHAWVGSYGAQGVRDIHIELIPQATSAPLYYDVTLYFVEPDVSAHGQRVFDLLIQGERAGEQLDIARLAGGIRKVWKTTLNAVPVNQHLEVSLMPREGSLPAVVSGISVRQTAQRADAARTK